MATKKIVAFSSSPRKKSNSDILCDSIIAGAVGGGADVEKIKLNGLSIHPCIACEACQKSLTEPCIYDDDMTPLIDKIREADALIFASPIYFFTVNAQMKVMLDRLLAIFGEGKFDAMIGKKAAIALTYGEPEPLNSGVTCAHEMFQRSFGFLGMDFVGCAHAAGHEAGVVKQNTNALENAAKIGAKLCE
ncbi:MAG: flavodoxin family protein [Phycisphaerae bacterium]|nr:flavodoxin family protein [Phycisphaerae bacterium]